MHSKLNKRKLYDQVVLIYGRGDALIVKENTVN